MLPVPSVKGRDGGHRWRVSLIMVERVVIHAADNLSLVVHPQQHTSLASDFAQRRQQNAHQDGYDGNGDEKFNEGKSSFASKPCAKYVTFGTDNSPPRATLSQILNHDTTDRYMLQPLTRECQHFWTGCTLRRLLGPDCVSRPVLS